MPTIPSPDITQFSSRIARDAADGHVSKDEAEAWIAIGRELDFSPDVRQQLAHALVQHQDAFEPTARYAVKAALLKKSYPQRHGRIDLPDPALRQGHAGKVRYAWFDGALFKDGAAPKDVWQGRLPNCNPMASTCSAAAFVHKDLERAFRANGDGTFTVRFYETQFVRAPKPVDITVDAQLPSKDDGRNLYYGESTQDGELWVAILEKAYAQWRGGYDKLTGGASADVLEALTGRRGIVRDIGPATAESAFRAALECVANKRPAVVQTAHDPDRYEGTGVVPNHAYAVIGAQNRDGKSWLTLRNPWATVEPNGFGQNDGIFDVDQEGFTRLFATLHHV